MTTRHKNFLIFPRWVIDTEVWGQLNRKEQSVYVVILRYANPATGECYPSRKTISIKAGISYSSISSATQGLARLGLLRKSHRKYPGNRERLTYTINYTPPAFLVAENLGREGAEKAAPGVAEKPSQGVAENLGHRTIVNKQKHSEAEKGQIKAANNDLLSEVLCEYKGKLLSTLTTAFDSAYIEAWGDKTTLWLEIRAEVASYHSGRNMRGLPCNYRGCVTLVAAILGHLKSDIRHPANYFKRALEELLEKELDAHHARKESGIRARTTSTSELTPAANITRIFGGQNGATQTD